MTASAAQGARHGLIGRLGSVLRAELLPALLLLAAVLLWLIDPRPWAQVRGWLDLHTLAGLAALLAVAEGVRGSGLVQRLARVLVSRMHSQRALAGMLLLLSAALAMLLTNDVALFLLVPLTLALCDMTPLPRVRLVAFEALAVNAGSSLSPIGNPQNLMLWHQAGCSIAVFVRDMALPAGIMASVLALMAWMAFPGKPLHVDPMPEPRTPLDRPLAAVAPVLLLMLVVLLEMGHPLLALGMALLVLGALRPRVLRAMDWSLVATFALLLLVLGHLADMPAIAHALDRVDWRLPRNTMLGGMALSQVISNVPATITLVHRVPDTMMLAAAVNIGGSGLAIGSLANLIALRLEGSRRIWWRFHLWSLPYLAVVAVLAAWLMP